jgi:hypothetical protein
MASKRTWIWVGVAVAGTGVLALMAVAGAGVYFVSTHVRSSGSTPAEALQSFSAVAVSFEGQRPLYELDARQKPHLTTPLASRPSSPTKATDLLVQVWDPDEQRLIHVSIPFWLLRFGDQKMRVLRDEAGFDFRELPLDVSELGRIGPALVFDYRNQDGMRVLLWTK